MDRDIVIDLAAHLAAAVSLLERAYKEKKPPNKIVASDRMFKQMLKDYEDCLARARKVL